MKLIYSETKMEYVNNAPFVTVRAYYPEHNDSDIEHDLPALISIENGHYLEHKDFPFKKESVVWKIVLADNEATVIRQAIKFIDECYEQVTKSMDKPIDNLHYM